jgi:hypothetical protein
MALVEIETQGESHRVVINTDQIAYIGEGIYGTSVHFASGEYVVCIGDLEDVKQRLFGSAEPESLLIAKPRTPA